MMNFIRPGLLLLLISIFSLPASAERVIDRIYVSDQLKINLRRGTSNRHKIIGTLRSGTPLEVLNVDKAAGYTEVKTNAGRVGWALTRQLTRTPSARNQLIDTQRALSETQTQLDATLVKLTTIGKEFGTVKYSLEENIAENKILTEELTDIRQKASSAIFIEKERNRLQKELTDIQITMKDITQENEILKRADRNVLFMLGSGTVTLGLILGLILPRVFSRKSKSSWGDGNYL
jgi:SH3 domain protein